MRLNPSGNDQISVICLWTIRQNHVYGISNDRPVGARSISDPRCMPETVARTATLSSVATTSSISTSTFEPARTRQPNALNASWPCVSPKPRLWTVASSVRKTSTAAVSPPATTSLRNRRTSAAFSCGVVIIVRSPSPTGSGVSGPVVRQENQNGMNNKHYLYDIKVGLVIVS